LNVELSPFAMTGFSGPISRTSILSAAMMQLLNERTYA
jgi:hypothetical protein